MKTNSKTKRRSRIASAEALEVRALLSGYTPSTVAEFATTNGASPGGGLIVDPTGNFYGTTSAGGASGNGTVFKIFNQSSTITTIASFNGSNGSAPRGTLYRDAAGNLWGTTSSGTGTTAYGSVFKIANGSSTITTAGVFTSAGIHQPMGNLVADSAGDLFGTCAAGGTSGQGGVFELAKNAPAVTTVAAASNGSPQANLTIDSAGNLYGATAFGGTYGDGTVFEVYKNATTITTRVQFSGTATSTAMGYLPNGGLVVDSAGNIFGALYGSSATTGYGSLYQVSNGSSSAATVATFNGSNGANPSGGLTVDAGGDLFGTTKGQSDGSQSFVFEYNHGTLSDLAAINHSSVTTGLYPQGQLLIDSTANIFGTTSQGGSAGVGTVYHLTAVGTLSVVQQPTTAVAGVPLSPVVKVKLLDPSGNLETGYSPVVTMTSGGGGSVAAVNGVATFTNVVLTSVGPNFLYFESPGFGPIYAAAIRVSPGPPTKLRFDDPITDFFVGELIDGTGEVFVDVTDAYGNQTSPGHTDTIQLTLNNGTGDLLGTTTSDTSTGPYFRGLTTYSAATGCTLVASDLSNSNIASGVSTVFSALPQIYSFGAYVRFDAAHSNPNGPVLLDAANHLFLTSYGRGTQYNGSAFQVPSNIGWIDYNGLAGAVHPTGGLTRDSAGNFYGATTTTVFKIPANGSTPATVATVAGTPQGSLVVNSSGDVFGVTASGGTYGFGSVFRIPAGVSAATTIYSFNGSTDGKTPQGLVADAAGNIFGATYYDPASNGGAIFEVPAGSTNLVILGYAPGAQTSALTVDAAGDVFGATKAGGDYGYGTLFEVAHGSSTVTTLTSFQYINGYAPAAAPVADAFGNLFGSTTQGGGYGFGTIYELFNGHASPTPIAALTANYDIESPMTFDSAGDLFGVAKAGGYGYGEVFSLTNGEQLSFVQQPTDTPRNTVITPPVKVAPKDLYGNVVTTDQATIGLSILQGPTGGTLAGTTTAATVNGTATFSNLSANVSGGYQLLATDLTRSIPVVYSSYFNVGASAMVGLMAPTYLRLDSDHAHVDVYNNSTGSGTPAMQLPYASLGSILVYGSSPSQTLTVDLSNGNVIPAIGIYDTTTGTVSTTVYGLNSADTVVKPSGEFDVDGGRIFTAHAVTFYPVGGATVLNVSAGSLTLAARAGATSTTQVISAITVGGSATLDVSQLVGTAGPQTVVIGSLSMNATGRFDLGRDAAVVSGGVLSTANGLVKSGFNAGGWNGAGILSSTAAASTSHLTSLGVIQNNQSGTAIYGSSKPFHGYVTAAADVLIGYTWLGDANLDGKVDGADYSRIDNGFNGHGSATGWFNGDFNYDGAVDGSDYALIDNAFNRQTSASPASHVAKVAAVLSTSTAVNLPRTGAVFNDDPIAAQIVDGIDRRKHTADKVSVN